MCIRDSNRIVELGDEINPSKFEIIAFDIEVLPKQGIVPSVEDPIIALSLVSKKGWKKVLFPYKGGRARGGNGKGDK